MKICILTFAKGDSYGAVLQSYGLASVLRNWGHDVEFFHLTWYNSWRQRVWSVITPTSYRFERFRKQYLRSFSSPCFNGEDLRKAASKAELCIVGSDQVWNPDITKKYMLHYFFDFLPASVPRISYAASFGNSEWDNANQTSAVKSLLEKFSAISVREDSGVTICREVFHVQAVKVLDPTMLVNDYVKTLRIPKYVPRIVSFKFAQSTEYYSLLSSIKEKLGLPVVVMDPLTKSSFRGMIRFSPSLFNSIESWIGHIASAELVVTDSFHCMVFSILHRRQFIVVPGQNKRRGRMYSLLKELGLLDRYYETYEEVVKTGRWKSRIDYDHVFEILGRRKKESLDFLFSALRS